MKTNEVIQLLDTYGNITLKELVERVQGTRIHKCPQCEGRGFIVEYYNAYPSGLPDSGWVYEEGRRELCCNLCKGHGYTEKEYKPKLVQQGWEEAK